MTRETLSTITADDLRLAIARSRTPNYKIAAAASINPMRLSRLVNGREPITVALATRIFDACERAKERRP
jgi:plasmid maintenance system antidote protein VapI